MKMTRKQFSTITDLCFCFSFRYRDDDECDSSDCLSSSSSSSSSRINYRIIYRRQQRQQQQRQQRQRQRQQRQRQHRKRYHTVSLLVVGTTVFAIAVFILIVDSVSVSVNAALLPLVDENNNGGVIVVDDEVLVAGGDDDNDNDNDDRDDYDYDYDYDDDYYYADNNNGLLIRNKIKKKTNNNNNNSNNNKNKNKNNNKNELSLLSLLWGRQKKKEQAPLSIGNINNDDDDDDADFTTHFDEDYKKRIKEILKKFYKLTDPRFAKAALSVADFDDAIKQVDNNNLLYLPSNIEIINDEDDDDEKQDLDNVIDDDNNVVDNGVDDDDDVVNDVVMLPGTVLEVFRTPLHPRREDDDEDEDEDEDHTHTNSQYHHNSNLPISDYYDEDNIVECDSRYMLCESIHLELGNVPKHYMDFAYTSVLRSSSSSSSSTFNSKSASSTPTTPTTPPPLEVESSSTTTTDAALSLLFDNKDDAIERINNDEKDDDQPQPTTCKDIDIVSTTTTTTTTTTTNNNENNEKKQNNKNYIDNDDKTQMSSFSAWWNWWLPFTNSDWWKVSNDSTHTISDYDMGTTGAFAGGSNGEVWRGHRVCNSQSQSSSSSSSSSSSNSNSKKKCDDQTQLVLKRLRVERGYLLLEAGLREVYFGKLIQTQMNSDEEQNMFTVYVDHFFREVPKKRRIIKKALFGVGAGLPAASHHYHHQQGSDLELWIVYEDAGPSLRSYIYTPTVTDGGFIMYQHSKLWTQLRTFTNEEQAYHAKTAKNKDESSSASLSALQVQNLDDHGYDEPEPLFTSSSSSSSSNNSNKKKKKKKKKRTNNNRILHIGRIFMQNTLREILSAAAELHKRGIVHRDIKPSNVMCKSDVPIDDYIHSFVEESDDDDDDDSSSLPKMHCRLGDFSSGWDRYTNEHLYTKGPTPGEQTDEYAPPESFVGPNWVPFYKDKPQSYDSWSIGVLALELLLGTPNVFSVDQRTNALLTYKMKRANASENEISNALYLAALSNFCIYIPSNDTSDKPQSWPLRHGDPLHKTSMVKESCTLQDFHRALRARDPLGIGFDSSTDLLLHLIWQLLAFHPDERMTAEEALQHPYFISPDGTLDSLNEIPGFHNALESQMLDPRIDFNVADDIKDFVCPKCGRVFHDWESCHRHTNLRKHSKFCTYNHTYLPSCINTHTMLPEHPTSGYCDLQGRRPTIEDFHSIHLNHDHQFYGMFDGHTGNLASKFAASELYGELMRRLPNLENVLTTSKSDGEGSSGDEQYSWKEDIRINVTQAFEYVHDQFLDRITTMTSPIVEVGTAPNMDQSGTTATAILVTDNMIIAATLGDSRAVISSSSTAKSDENSDPSRSSSSHSNKNPWKDFPSVSAVQFSIDHVASHPTERDLVIERGGFVSASGGIPRVNGILAVTRSIGDADLAPVLSREPHVLVLDRSEIRELCGSLGRSSNKSEQNNKGHTIPCFVILASDGLWDVMSNQEAVDMVVDIILRENIKMYDDIDASEITTIPSSSSDTKNKNDIDIYYNDHEAADGPFQEAAERLAVEAYVRGSTDNIGVCVVAVDYN